MKLLKAAVAGAFLIIAAAGVQAKEAEPVRTVKYSAYTEEQYGLDMTLKPNGKVIRDHHSLDIEGKKKSEIATGTWSQKGDKVTVKLNRGKLSKTLVFQIMQQNNMTEIGEKCNGVYGLALVSEKGSKKIWAASQMWPENLIFKNNGPCQK